MKKIVAMMVAAMMALSFSMVAVAADDKTAEKPAAEKSEKVEKKEAKKEKKEGKKEKKEVKKDKKKDKKEAKDDKKKDADAKPATKGKKEVSGC